MVFDLKPDLTISSLDEISLQALWEIGIRGLIFDLDNTITPWRQDEITREARSLIEEALLLNFEVAILSNATRKRTEKIAGSLKLPFLAPAWKPRRGPYTKLLKGMRLSGRQAAVIGDQLFTDVLGGNRAGCYTILVNPLEKKEFFGTKIARFLERLLGRRT